MNGSRKKFTSTRPVQRRSGRAAEDDVAAGELHPRSAARTERRSKHYNDDWRIHSRGKEKVTAVASSPPLKKRRAMPPRQEVQEEEDVCSDDSEDESGGR